jgi:hypothetical protein
MFAPSCDPRLLDEDLIDIGLKRQAVDWSVENGTNAGSNWMLSSSPQTARNMVGNCPENFENRAALVGAEIARIEGRALDAMELYEQAIRSARAKQFCPQRGARLRSSRALLCLARPSGLLSHQSPRRLPALGRRRQGALSRRCAPSG